jgi:hypothetical protein
VPQPALGGGGPSRNQSMHFAQAHSGTTRKLMGGAILRGYEGMYGMQLVQRFQLFQLVHFNWLNHMVGILRAIGMQEAFGIFEIPVMSAHMIPGLVGYTFRDRDMPRLRFPDRDAPPPLESPDWSASDVMYAICYRGIPSRTPPLPLSPQQASEKRGGV